MSTSQPPVNNQSPVAALFSEESQQLIRDKVAGMFPGETIPVDFKRGVIVEAPTNIVTLPDGSDASQPAPEAEQPKWAGEGEKEFQLVPFHDGAPLKYGANQLHPSKFNIITGNNTVVAVAANQGMADLICNAVHMLMRAYEETALVDAKSSAGAAPGEVIDVNAEPAGD